MPFIIFKAHGYLNIICLGLSEAPIQQSGVFIFFLGGGVVLTVKLDILRTCYYITVS